MPAMVSPDEDVLHAADEVWEAFAHEVFWTARRGLPTGPVMDRYRPRIEAAVLGEPDQREFRELTFDEQRAYMARARREWAAADWPVA